MYLKTILPYRALWGPFPDIYSLERFVTHKIMCDPHFTMYFSGGYELVQVLLTPPIWELKGL